MVMVEEFNWLIIFCVYYLISEKITRSEKIILMVIAVLPLVSLGGVIFLIDMVRVLFHW
jgi:hypothetical protein